MSWLRTLGPLFLLSAALLIQNADSLDLHPQDASPGANCSFDSLPSDVRGQLQRNFAAWRLQQPTTLRAYSRKTWAGRRLLACLGLAVGRFQAADADSYAVLLVRDHPDAGYRFLVFNPRSEKDSYEAIVVERSDDQGASNYFIRSVPIRELFGEAPRGKLQVQAPDGILMFDSAEQEYETDVFFWSNGRFHQQPIDE
jgi:hypothetical protein